MPDPNDSRMGLPSASSFDRLARCPSSWLACKDLPEPPADSTADAGTRIHAAMETGSDDELQLDEAEVAARLREMESRETANFLAYYNLSGPVRVIREERFLIRNRQTLEVVASARPDYCAVVADTGYACVFNFKTGFADVTPSERSWQSRIEVLSLWHDQMDATVKCIRGGFLASRLKSTCDYTDYTPEDLRRVERDMLHVLWKLQQPNAERVPGAHCRYCPARSVCREAATYALVASSRMPTIGGKPDELAIVQSVARMTPGELAFVFKRRTIANAVFDAVEDRLKMLPEDTLSSVGYKVTPGNITKEITDTATAFQRLSGLLTDAERVQCIRIVRGRAVEALASRKGLSKKRADEEILEALGDAVNEKQGEPRLRAL